MTALVAVAALALVGGLLAGCADIPTSGSPQAAPAERVDPDQGQTQVRVIAQGPRPGDSRFAVVSGFLEASGTVEGEQFFTARRFLTSAEAARWRPETGITIYDHTDVTLTDDVDTVVFAAPARGSVDDQGVFTPERQPRGIEVDFGLVQVDNEWRIDRVPSGLFISEQDFQREYVALDHYFVAAEPRSPVLVPDPVHVPLATRTPSTVVQSLLRGPSRWLSPVVTTALPPDAALAEPVSVVANVARVRFTASSVPEQPEQRDLMVAQLVMTLTQDTEINAVEVSVDGERPLSLRDTGPSTLTRADLTSFLPAELRDPAPPAYFLRNGSAFVTEPEVSQVPLVLQQADDGAGGEATADPDAAAEPGVVGPENKLAELVAAPDGTEVAAISADRSALFVSRAGEPGVLFERERGKQFRSPSFDGDGNLWVLSGSAGETLVRRYPPAGKPETVAISGFEARQITTLRLASDGVRLAMVLATVEGPQVYLAQAVQDSAGLQITGLRRMAGGLLQPQAVGWADPGRLVVLAAQRNAQPQPFEVALNGSVAALGPPLADITEITIALEAPMVAATSEAQIWRLGAGGTWFKEGGGSAPRYPG